MAILDSLIILSFFLQRCFFYMLLQSLDPMEQDCFLAYKKEKHYCARYHKKIKIKIKSEKENMKIEFFLFFLFLKN